MSESAGKRYRRQVPPTKEGLCICEYCAIIDDKIVPCHSIHHVLPREKRGNNKIKNLMALCEMHHVGWHEGKYGNIRFMRTVHLFFLKNHRKFLKKRIKRLERHPLHLDTESDIAYQKYLNIIED